MPTFDVISEFDKHELANAVDQANRELETRFDFRGTGAKYELKDEEITLTAPADFQLQQLLEVLENKLIKRGIDPRVMDTQKAEVAIHQAKQVVKLRQGLEQEVAKKIVQFVKNSKMKVQGSIQGDKVRFTGKKRDDLQEAIALLKTETWEVAIQFDNFRD